jgi:flagellin-like hook-associated protein FlgL
MQRLSSGSRINTGRDDPAGLAMATGLESQRRGLLQAVRNLNDSRGFLETADGAMAEQTNMIQRMRELAVQASNGTLDNSTRRYLDNEFQSLLAEFNRVTNQTQFNGLNLLDGSFGTKNIQVGSQKGQTISLSLASMFASQVFATTTTITTTGGTSIVGSGTFKSRTTAAVPTASSVSVELADFNGDGKLDLTVVDGTGSDAVYISLGNGNGTFNTMSELDPGSLTTPWHSIGKDLNGDGKIDLVELGFNDSIANIWLGNGNGTFQTRATVKVGATGGFFVSFGDLNGDGLVDFVVGDYGQGTNSILIGNGNGTFQARKTISSCTKPTQVILSDVNGDSKLDMVYTDSGSDWVAISLGNGNGTFQSRTTMVTGDYPQSIVATDLNGDGKVDLVTADSDGDTISALLGNGNGTFQTRKTAKTGAYPNQLTSADLNGDGKIDIITADLNGNTLSVFFGNGNGTFQTRLTLAEGTAERVAAGDLNGDGVIDLASADFFVGHINIWIGNSTTVTTQGGTSTLTTAASMYLTTQSNSEDALAILDSALAYVNSARANIGALQSRLDFASSVNQNTIENISAARSQIMDTDMAAETAEFSRLQILQKAGIAVLGQANVNSTLSLKLLENL